MGASKGENIFKILVMNNLQGLFDFALDLNGIFKLHYSPHLSYIPLTHIVSTSFDLK